MSQHSYRINEANGVGRQHVKLSFLLLSDLHSWYLSSLNVEFPIMGGKNCLRSELLKSLYYKDCTYIGNLWQDESYGCRTLHTTLTWHLSFLTKSIGLFSMSGCGSAEMTCTVCKEHHTQWHHCHSCFRHNCISAISVLSGYHCTVFTALSF